LSLPAATVAATLGGVLVALVVLLLPTAWIEAQVAASGLPDVLAAAAPPLGITARLALMLLLAGIAAALLWGLGRIAFGRLPVVFALPARRSREKTAEREVAAIPVLRRSDAHPDAPARAPVLAMRDLGTPFLEVTAASSATAIVAEPVEQALPEDLDLPLAAFDPQAIPAPIVTVRPLFQADAELGDDVDVTRLTPQIRAGFAAPPEPEPEPVPLEETSTRALLVRLEQGLARREQGEGPRLAPGRDETLQATLASLRRWASPA
jgi:hypothetical protein